MLVNALSWTGRIISGNLNGHRTVALVFYASPLGVGVEDSRSFVDAPHKESSPVGHVGYCPVLSFIPYQGHNLIVARMKVRSKIYFLVVPVLDVATSWTYGNDLVIDKKLITVVARNPDTHGLGYA